MNSQFANCEFMIVIVDKIINMAFYLIYLRFANRKYPYCPNYEPFYMNVKE